MRSVIVGMIFIAGCATIFADGSIESVSGHGRLHYNESAGRITQPTLSRSLPHLLWSVTAETGYFYAYPSGHVVLDWGDMSGELPIGMLGFTEYTNSQATDGDITIYLGLYGSENGWNSTGRQLIGMYEIVNVPGSTHPMNEYWGWEWTLEPSVPLPLTGDDLDGDGLIDFGYSLGFRLPTPGAKAGPSIAGPTYPQEPELAAGIEDAFDYFDGSTPGSGYLETRDFGGDPFAQFYFAMWSPELHDGPGPCDADLNHDCEVGLSDLAQLLSNYGMTSGAQWQDGDIEPLYPRGDGDVDLADLATLLAQYGPCNRPPCGN